MQENFHKKQLHWETCWNLHWFWLTSSSWLVQNALSEVWWSKTSTHTPWSWLEFFIPAQNISPLTDRWILIILLRFTIMSGSARHLYYVKVMCVQKLSSNYQPCQKELEKCWSYFWRKIWLNSSSFERNFKPVGMFWKLPNLKTLLAADFSVFFFTLIFLNLILKFFRYDVSTFYQIGINSHNDSIRNCLRLCQK